MGGGVNHGSQGALLVVWVSSGGQDLDCRHLFEALFRPGTPGS